MDASRATIVMAGDSCLVVELEERIDPVVNAAAVELAGRIEARRLPGVRDVVVSFRSVAVYFDPLALDERHLREELTREIAGVRAAVPAGAPTVEIPVCYGGHYGPDLGDVARFAACSEEEVVRLHTGATYRVYMLGFVPGFSYLASVPAAIAAPRRPTPRLRVPAGSVAIAGLQTGIYPIETPGGWNLIGRAAVKLYDPSRADPILLRPGYQVRFASVTPEAFAAGAPDAATASR
jgi:KipI family sensor histidine kinase inhibitor